ncbi:WD40-repeat-containing domain protein [Xylaria bambusicola]|uniref:WD40-repeat-containing domain protein n=1 Tax=Xylaria bambusicola TaxID=326684 RepID=UPI0020077B7D|nr:WD40-repeat-containing domain protein [Xylaria bambusicola]KAI0515251.1 WD40-repeat-containing domain protein [Xylaria bambusicola]
MRPQNVPPGSSSLEPDRPSTEEDVSIQPHSVGSTTDNAVYHIVASTNHDELQNNDHDFVDAEEGGAPLYDISMEGMGDQSPMLPPQSVSSGPDTIDTSTNITFAQASIQTAVDVLTDPVTIHYPLPEAQPVTEESDVFGFGGDEFEPYPLLTPNAGPGILPDNSNSLDFLKDIRSTPRNELSIAQIRRSRITYEDLKGDACDPQGINWQDLGVTRGSARKCRTKLFRNYTNIPDSDAWDSSMPDKLPRRHENYFRFRSMDLCSDVRLMHFQLRNIMGCASRTAVYYPCVSGTIRELDPTTSEVKIAMKFKNSDDAQISTLAAEEGILITGGFHGTYRYRSIGTGGDPHCYDGRLTDHVSGITNHVQVNSSRRSSIPLAAFASNDFGFRMVDLARNEIVLDKMYDHALNCTALSPDKRLRVMVGDLREVLITDAETGEVLQGLNGHRDFGFACDWAPDGWTIATGNQDKTIRIWDARMWKNSVAVLRSEMAGVRSLRFSPLGSGKRLLLAAEEADVINLIDAQTFESKQTIDIFGELAGVSFANAGQEIMALSSDPVRGGVLRLERCDHGAEDTFSYMRRQYLGDYGWVEPGYDWLSTPQQVVDHPRTQVTLSQKQRQASMVEDWFF